MHLALITEDMCFSRTTWQFASCCFFFPIVIWHVVNHICLDFKNWPPFHCHSLLSSYIMWSWTGTGCIRIAWPPSFSLTLWLPSTHKHCSHIHFELKEIHDFLWLSSLTFIVSTMLKPAVHYSNIKGMRNHAQWPFAGSDINPVKAD